LLSVQVKVPIKIFLSSQIHNLNAFNISEFLNSVVPTTNVCILGSQVGIVICKKQLLS